MANYAKMSSEQLESARENLLSQIRGLEEKFIAAGKILEQKRLGEKAADNLERAQENYDEAVERLEKVKAAGQPPEQVIQMDALSLRGVVDKLRGK